MDAPTHTIEMQDQILRIEFSPYECSKNVLCIAFSNKITVGTVRFQEEDVELEDKVEFQLLQEFHHGTRVRAVAWSPETSLTVEPGCVVFASAGADHKLRVYTSDLETRTLQVLKGHSNYVNAITYQPEGYFLASVSDDNTCKIWDVKEGKHCVTTFLLTSAGMAVCYHREDRGKLLVGEKSGLLRLYNVVKQQAILSFNSSNVPLMSADWCPGNSLRVAAVSAGKLIVWDISRPSRPIYTRLVHLHGGQLVRFSRLSENLIATVGQPDLQLQVTHIQSKHPLLTSSLKLHGGLTWHCRLPYVCVGSDRKLHFWKIVTK